MKMLTLTGTDGYVLCIEQFVCKSKPGLRKNVVPSIQESAVSEFITVYFIQNEIKVTYLHNKNHYNCKNIYNIFDYMDIYNFVSLKFCS